MKLVAKHQAGLLNLKTNDIFLVINQLGYDPDLGCQ